MAYRSLEDCLLDLERTKQLVRVREQVDPHLEMAAVHLRVHEAGGPAILFENIKGCRFRAASNIFGTLGRSKFIFKDKIQLIERLIKMRADPASFFRDPLRNAGLLFSALQTFPLKNPSRQPVRYEEISISDLPLIKHWPHDGGAFVTLPQVFTEDVSKPGILHSNLGMYRIQLNGNEYTKNEEIGLHYQLHRGIGVHQSKAQAAGVALKVSVFIGGPPAHSIAAVMPLPEGISELRFAGILGGRRFRYALADGFTLSTDADFVITGEVINNYNKTEGPFGDHLGYYSLQHPFPVLKVHKVYARKNAIWPFTVVGRPPQEDTSFGELIHELTGNALQEEIPGLKEVHAVDAAGVHPLLLAIGSERYTPYNPTPRPAEILTIANHILGTGQLSLAKFLFITATTTEKLSAKNIPEFFYHMLERIDPKTDLHFYTNTSIDTLDYSGSGLNSGSKLVLAAYGEVRRRPGSEVPAFFGTISMINKTRKCLPGILVIEAEKFIDHESASKFVNNLNEQLLNYTDALKAWPVIVLADDAAFVAASLNNFLWVTFTRCNPSHDIHGVDSFTENKHWGCRGPMIIDARIKPHHAPPLEKDLDVERKIDRIFTGKGSLAGVLPVS